MTIKATYLTIGLILAGMIWSSFFPAIQSGKSESGFRDMEGKRIVHYFKEKTDSLSGPEIIELQDANGLTVWFGRHIFKDVCLTSECKMIRLWLFWDGAGNYLGMEIPENEPFTKSDHTAFEPADYEKLENILRDPDSNLRKMKQVDLIIGPEKSNPYEVDGYSGATRPGLEQLVVKDAVYTSYTLWHTVYGQVRDTLLRMLDARADKDYLLMVLDSGNPMLVAWGIKAVGEDAVFHALFYPQIAEAASSQHDVVSELAMNYFTPERLAGENEQHQLISQITRVKAHKKNDIIWKLHETGNVHESVVMQLLRYFDQGDLGIGSLNIVYLLVKPDLVSRNPEMEALLWKLASHENAYVRNLTTRLLNNGQ